MKSVVVILHHSRDGMQGAMIAYNLNAFYFHIMFFLWGVFSI